MEEASQVQSAEAAACKKQPGDFGGVGAQARQFSQDTARSLKEEVLGKKE